MINEQDRANGRRLTSYELAESLSRLQEWQTPVTMLDYANSLMDVLDTQHLFNQAGLNFLFEAWIGATFASIKFPNCQIRLLREDWPDFEIDSQTDGKFEIIEAQTPNRRRGLEYRQPAHWRDTGISEWNAVAESIPSVLSDASRRKTSKNYRGGKCGLVIYLNVDATFGVRQEEIVSKIPLSIEPARGAFDSVYVLWGNSVYS